jgi:hypothetical protein
LIDVGREDLVVRSTNLVPGNRPQHLERQTTMEKLLGQFLTSRP